MVEDNDQDMPMEDILSSIKNILEEEQNELQDIVEPAYEEADDVLELSPDMRMMGEVVEEINLDAELAQASSTNITETATEAEDVLEITLGSEDFDSDPFFENDTAGKYGEQNDVEQTVVETESVSEKDFVSEIEIPEIVDDKEETVATLDSFLTTEQEIISDKESESDEENTAKSFEPNIVLEPIVETEKSEEVIAKENTAEEIISEDHAVEEVAADKAVDVSANIISNFAKMFSQEEKIVEEPKIEKQAEAITAIGDGSKTIEDVVSSVIRQIIGDEVAANWKDGLDYNNLARQEIQKQTKEWLDQNLPLVVEKIVQKEIERVMAKVGNNQ